MRRQEGETASIPKSALFPFLLLLVVLVVAVRDLLGGLGEQVGGFDLAERARQLVAFAIQVLAVAAEAAVPRGQRGFHGNVHVHVFHRGLVGHLQTRKEEKRDQN